jgi:hypothetical protein
MPDAEHYREFLRAVALRAHLGRLTSPALQTAFLDVLTRQGAQDEPPFSLELRLLNLQARRPGSLPHDGDS